MPRHNGLPTEREFIRFLKDWCGGEIPSHSIWLCVNECILKHAKKLQDTVDKVYELKAKAWAEKNKDTYKIFNDILKSMEKPEPDFRIDYSDCPTVHAEPIDAEPLETVDEPVDIPAIDFETCFQPIGAESYFQRLIKRHTFRPPISSEDSLT